MPQVFPWKEKAIAPIAVNRLRENSSKAANGFFARPADRPIYENPIPATCVVVVDPGNQVVLVKRSVPPKYGQWCLPGGFIELGESPEAGAKRELLEETGLSGKIKTLLGVRHAPSDQYHSIMMVGYLVDQFSGQLRPGDDASEASWFAITALPPVAFDSHRFFLKEYQKVHLKLDLDERTLE